ncbi:MAG: bifunctional DNA-formamidopyrimidine glycosylase/DNA-(apurinic or apyrimidinic site) lyase [Phycisphaeraceae bacterium]|nr:bifunctional DNA-formamidopyrimidine glycosylase/DNA-(apurinic or apyrimidinic site) lyase [Phycisphaerae bacterium]MBX3393182.1 bifunctional DNA-formamidopyrimidine glycosylase/DNA-(apurinic or apyrimidinic site) lyase [Phycisphaeraceae bacterium]HRJ49828.1 bifunctional DNA-formamidopyrimidine glycosylase/DNA-(apurinic or apyrimidinic site) lyase [Phycisphaerales bacterium]
MPELPEAETIRRALARSILGMRVVRAVVRRPDIVTLTEPERRVRLPVALLEGETIESILRHGKQLAVVSRNGRAVGIRLGMTGSLIVRDRPTLLDRHDHVVWTLQDRDQSTRVIFRDPRRFGGLTCFPSRSDLNDAWRALGPDAHTISTGQLHRILSGRRLPIKAALLNQRVIAGVGNIYADESLHLSGLNPGIMTNDLQREHVVRLARAIRMVLSSAIRHHGSTIGSFSDPAGVKGNYQDRHRVYGRAGLPCHLCGKPLVQGVIAQRTTVYCGKCQTMPTLEPGSPA